MIFAGQEVSDIHRDGKVYDVMVWSTPETRHSLNSVRELLLDTPDGGHVRLGDIADVRIAPDAEHHQARKRLPAHRRSGQRARTRPRLGRAGRRGAPRADRSSRSAITPSCWARRRSGRPPSERLLLAAMAAAVGIFLLLQAPSAAGAWRPWPSCALPAALVGGVLAAYCGDGIISLGSLVGFLTVLGIAARNGILLIHHYQHLERYEGEPFGPGLVLRGARERLSPILMTTLATGLALVPLVITGDIPGPRDRAPDGRRHSGRPGHVDAAQPVRRAGRCTCALAARPEPDLLGLGSHPLAGQRVVAPAATFR